MLATQNPIEMEGTYPLPEAQLDRFFFKLTVPYPSEEELLTIAERTTGGRQPAGRAGRRRPDGDRDDGARPRRADRQAGAGLRRAPDHRAPTRTARTPRRGASGTCATARARAACRRWCWAPRSARMLEGRFNVAFEDIREVALPALRHRVILNFEADAEGITADRVIQDVLLATQGRVGCLSRPLLDGAFLERLERLSLVSRRRVAGQGKGDRRSIRKGTSIEFVDYRHYTPGDDPRSVDWNIYRRSGNLFVKQFEEEEILTAHLLVDVSRSMDWGSPSKLQFAARLAAALGYIVLAGSSRLVVTTLSGATRDHVRPGLGPRQVAGLIEFLPARPAARRDRPGRRARRYARRAESGQAILISDLLTPKFEQGIRRLLDRRLEVTVLHVLAPEEVHPPMSGDLTLIDRETGDEVRDHARTRRRSTGTRRASGPGRGAHRIVLLAPRRGLPAHPDRRAPGGGPVRPPAPARRPPMSFLAPLGPGARRPDPGPDPVLPPQGPPPGARGRQHLPLAGSPARPGGPRAVAAVPLERAADPPAAARRRCSCSRWRGRSTWPRPKRSSTP